MGHFPESNPYETPHASSEPIKSPQWEQAKNKVSLPAIFLMILAPISIPCAAFDLFGRMIADPEDIPLVDQNNRQQVEQAMMVSNIFAGLDILHIVLQVVVFLGALQMLRLKSKSFAMAAAVIACVPCLSPCCFGGIPLGVWALVAMNDPMVKQAFES